jgi:hypothetical protein
MSRETGMYIPYPLAAEKFQPAVTNAVDRAMMWTTRT